MIVTEVLLVVIGVLSGGLVGALAVLIAVREETP